MLYGLLTFRYDGCKCIWRDLYIQYFYFGFIILERKFSASMTLASLLMSPRVSTYSGISVYIPSAESFFFFFSFLFLQLIRIFSIN